MLELIHVASTEAALESPWLQEMFSADAPTAPRSWCASKPELATCADHEAATSPSRESHASGATPTAARSRFIAASTRLTSELLVDDGD
jgi:hypothetical protein